MNLKTRGIVAVILTGMWVNASEFFRNEILLKEFWIRHYQSLGMTFPSEPFNGMIWIVWGLLFAIAIYIISRKFRLLQTTLISWFTAFVLMWVVAFNLNVLPMVIVIYAFPLSLVEAFIGSYICLKLSPNDQLNQPIHRSAFSRR